MKINHGIGSIAVLFATPLVTGLSVGIAPSSAAIIAGSAAEVAIYNFSDRPTETGTSTNTYAQTIANKGLVISEANANAVFLSNCQQLLAANLSESTVKGDGSKVKQQFSVISTLIPKKLFPSLSRLFYIFLHLSITANPNAPAPG